MHCLTSAELPPPPPGRTGWPWTEGSPQLSDAMPDGSPWPRISIVTPSYNQGQFIEETIRSVLLQGYPNIEYMITDGGSTDGSVETIAQYGPWLAYWVSEKDRGQTHAINKGWAHADGEILAYLNSDDVLLPATLYRVADAFRQHPHVSVVYGDCQLVDGETRFIRRLGSQPYSRSGLLLADYIHQSSTFIRHDVVQRVGLLDETFHMSMDYEYWLRLAMADLAMLYVPDVLSLARLTTSSKTGSMAVRFLDDALRVLDRIYTMDDLPEDVLRVKRRAYGNAWGLGAVRYFDVGCRGAAITALLNALRWDPLPGWKVLALRCLILAQVVVGVRWWSARTVEKAGLSL